MAVHDVKLSKTLSWVLRHQAIQKGLDMQEDGYVPCRQVVALLAQRCIPGMTQARLLAEVAACPKRRFELSPDGEYVRATRGHSIRSVDDMRLLHELVDTSTVGEATYGVSEKQWEVIKSAGLSCGSKNHIHIATPASKNGYVMGAGRESHVVIYIDVPRAIRDGIKFFLASNGVLLTRGVAGEGVLPAAYFLKAVLKTRDGEKNTAIELE